MMGKFTVLLLLLVIGVQFCSSKTSQVSCERKEKTESFGRDASYRSVEVDIGECEAVDSNHTNWTASSDSDCSRQCAPRSHDLKTISTRSNGPTDVYTVRSCFATRRHCIMMSCKVTHCTGSMWANTNLISCAGDCKRKADYVYMFPYSEYETKVDVGICVGQCGNRTGSFLGCVPTRTKQVAVKGPNGDHVIDKIETCSCENTTCYRADYFQAFWEMVDPETNNTTTRKKEKVINVGRCVGTCPGIDEPQRCYPDPFHPHKRICFPILPKPAKCRPAVAKIHSFTDNFGVVRNISTVVKCGCLSG